MNNEIILNLKKMRKLRSKSINFHIYSYRNLWTFPCTKKNDKYKNEIFPQISVLNGINISIHKRKK